MSDDRIKKSLDRVTMPDQPVAKVVVTKKGDDWLYQAFMGDEHKFDIASGIALDVEYLFKKLS